MKINWIDAVMLGYLADRNKMKAIKVVNITCLIAALSLIVFFQNLYSIDSEKISKGIYYMGKIVRNETLSAVQLNHISDMIEGNPSKTYNSIEGVECFLKVYYDLHLHDYDHDLNLNFQLFEHSQMEYRRVQKCSDFLNMVIERFQYSPDRSEKTNRILKVLHEIQYNYASENYIQLSTTINQFCLIALTKNEEKNIIPKMNSLLMQNDTNFRIIMMDNYSSDNTLIFGQYYLETYRKSHNIALTGVCKLAADKFFTKTSIFVREINKECLSEQIIIFVKDQSFIGSDALRIVSRAMTDIRIKLASFNSFNANTKSIGGSKIYTQNEAIILDTETVYAFRTQLLNSVAPAWKGISQIAEVASFEETFNNMVYFLYRETVGKESAYRHFDEIILRSTLTEPGKSIEIGSNFNKPVGAKKT